MINKDLSEACSEVLIILDNTRKEDVQKISDKFYNFLLENKSSDYNPDLILDSNINKVNLKPKSKALLGLIYKKYWCNAEEAYEFDRILENNQIREEDEKLQKYGIDVFEKIDNTNEKDENINDIENYKTENQELENIEEKNVFQKIVDWLKNILKK